MNNAQWVDAEKRKPNDSQWYEMCLLDLGEKTIRGWWTGIRWDGLHYKKQQVKRWKLIGNDGMTDNV